MSRRRTFYIKAFNIYENTYNRNVYGIWAGGGAFIFGIWAGAGIYEKLAKTTKSVGYEPAMVNMAKLMKKWFFCEKLMFLNRLNGYLFVAFRLQYFAQVFTIDWMRIPPNIKFIHPPNLKLWINVLHATQILNMKMEFLSKKLRYWNIQQAIFYWTVQKWHLYNQRLEHNKISNIPTDPTSRYYFT